MSDLYLTTSPVAGGQPGTLLYRRPLERRLVISKRGRDGEAVVRFEHFQLSQVL